MDRDEVAFAVEGWPPAKNEAKSMLATGHLYADRVLHLLQGAEVAIGNQRSPVFGGDALGFELIVCSPAEPPSDATNYLGGVGDVLLKRLAGMIRNKALLEPQAHEHAPSIWLPEFARRIRIADFLQSRPDRFADSSLADTQRPVS